MNDELRQAANGILLNGILLSVPITGQSVRAALVAGYAETLARAYIAAHPADDGEPITEDWLRSVGFVPRLYSDYLLVYDDAPYMMIMWDRRDGLLMIGYSKVWKALGKNKTRGDLRSLFKALGIELKEATK